MIQRMILINSANFDFVDINLSKDVFFLGDNASGKTTTTRAIHYLYNVEGRQLGIPKDKNSFEKHYFPYENSYIIYVFDGFFITMFKRSGKVQKWFSKQKFEIARVIADGTLVPHEQIRSYIKEAPYLHPQTNGAYRKIIYGQEQEYLDFSIASIKNYDAFLEVYNMVFNVDKAIVDMKSIKKAIQKSLQKEDEVLSLDFDTYIADMEAFKRDYLFFKKFDRQRDNIDTASTMMQELVALEERLQSHLGRIKYNLAMDQALLPELEVEVAQIEERIRRVKHQRKHWESRIHRIDTRSTEVLGECVATIKRLEALSEHYAPAKYEEAIGIASQREGLEKKRREITIALGKLKEEQGSVIESIEAQIAQLRRAIAEDIPYEKRTQLRHLEMHETQQCDSEIAQIIAQYEEIFGRLEEEISSVHHALEEAEHQVEQEKEVYERERDALAQAYETQQQRHRSEQAKIADTIVQKEQQIATLSRQALQEERKADSLLERYRQERTQMAQQLRQERAFLNHEIAKAKNLLHHEPHTLKAFLAQEVAGWEEQIYPLIDKSLLSLSVETLKPTLKAGDGDTFFGLRLDTTALEAYPTADALQETIAKHRQRRKIARKKSQERLRELQAHYDSEENAIRLVVDNLYSEIALEQKALASLEAQQHTYQEEQERARIAYEEKRIALQEAYHKVRESSVQKIEQIKQEIATQIQAFKREEHQRKRKIEQRKQALEQKIAEIKAQIASEEQEAIAQVETQIVALEAQKRSQTHDERLEKLEESAQEITQALKACYEAEGFLEAYEQQRKEIERLPQERLTYQRTKRFFEQAREHIQRHIAHAKQRTEVLEEAHRDQSERLKVIQEGITLVGGLEVAWDTVDMVEQREALKALVYTYASDESDYARQYRKFEALIKELSDLEHNAIIDINLSQDRFDTVSSIRELEHIAYSLEELQRFSLISYDNQKRARHTDFTNYLNNIIPQKLGTFDDLEDSFAQQKNKINTHLNRVDFGAIRDISLDMERTKGNHNTIASLMRSLGDKITTARTLFEDKGSLFFDKPKSIENIDEIIDTLAKIKRVSDGGAIHIFDTIDLTLSYRENGVLHKDKSHLKNDSSSGGNILLKVAIAISILALFANKREQETAFFLIVDEISRLQHQNQERLKAYINEHGFRTLFITPDPAYPDPTRAMYYMFRNSGKGEGGLKIVQMNLG